MMLSEAIAPYYVLAIVLVLFVVLVGGYMRPVVAFLAANVVLVVPGIISTQSIFAQLANPAVATIILLVIITGSIRKHYSPELFLDRLFRRVKRRGRFLALLLPPVAAVSGVINNTPVVVALAPYVTRWGLFNNVPPSKLLIPLSFATILGGMMTLVGTSTTLVLNGFMTESGLAGLYFLDLLLVGATVTVVGVVFLLTLGQRLLPSRKGILDSFQSRQREYIIETSLEADSKLIGKTVKAGGLRNLPSVYLVEILRNGRAISPVSPQEVIQAGDTLLFAGNTNQILDVVKAGLGITLPKKISDLKLSNTEVVEVVVNANSWLNGKRVKESDFRERYDSAIVAVHRNGERVQGRIGDVRLQAGDVVLLLTGSNFEQRGVHSRDLLLLSRKSEIAAPTLWKSLVFGAALLAGVAAIAFAGLQLPSFLLMLFLVLVLLRMINQHDVRRDFDLSFVAILTFSLSLGFAMVESGAGQVLAEGFAALTAGWPPIVVLAGLMIFTAVITSFITNVGAVSLAFPLALGLATAFGENAPALFLGVAYAASAAFLTPFSYQTNLLIYGPGGYKYADFIRIGLPMTVLYLACVCGMLMVLYPSLLG